MSEIDETWMRQALALAESGRGFVEPNPLVGAVVVRDGLSVGEGWHKRFGQAHAEINALAAAGDKARGATLYVTLEPCCHHGKTPPCTDAILRAGIRRVVASHLDPFSEVAGKGVAQLRTAGVEVDVGICETESRRLNAPYLTLVTKRRPYIHAKWAMTLDGKISTRTGDSKWISNAASRRRVQDLRRRMDAILIGIGTVLADDPLLTVRQAGARIPARIILDSHARLPLNSRLLQTIAEAPIIVVTSAENAQRNSLRRAGCEVLQVGRAGDRPPVGELLTLLAKRQMTNILVEGGSEVLGSFFDADLVDEVWVFVAPTIAGGGAKSPVAGTGADKISSALALANWEVESVDNNVLLHAYRH